MQTQSRAPSESGDASPIGKGGAAERMRFRRKAETNDAKLATPLLVVFKGEIVKRGEIEIPPLDCSLGTFSHEKVPLSSRGGGIRTALPAENHRK